jgi:hypothetical protein
MHNAKAGGEIGANGEFYKGGQFVADNPETVKSKYLKSPVRRICIEPYKWITANADTFGIWQQIEQLTFRYLWGKEMPIADWYTSDSVDEQNAEYYKALLEMYKRGERTINIVALANLRVKHNGGAFWLNNKLDLRDFATIKRS